jgi:hypothetical protein
MRRTAIRLRSVRFAQLSMRQDSQAVNALVDNLRTGRFRAGLRVSRVPTSIVCPGRSTVKIPG